MLTISYTFGIILGTFLECVVYGVFLSLFIATCYIQWEKSSKGRGLNRLMAVATGFFGVMVTAHLVVSLRQTVGVILHNPPGATVHLSPGPPFPTDGIILFMIFHFQTTVTDIIVTYRMYHIYDKNPWICVIPSITITAWFIVGCGLANQLREPIPNRRVQEAWGIAAFCLTIFDCVYLTSAISYRLWSVHRETVKAGLHVDDSVVLRAMRALIESAALWTTFAMITFFVARTKSNLVHTFAAVSSPIVGICFCLIIVRLGKIFPEAQEETWNVSIRIPASRAHRPNRVAVSFPGIELRQGTYASESREFPAETMESQKQEYANSSDHSPKGSRPSLSLHS